ncbi:MAG: HAD family hydrolase [Spirochaetaceae bacterium]|jgi:putative hydrolase of the HAD superfamily|nr:HAD family hydrolase [Spirochaetaceae bacterium]
MKDDEKLIRLIRELSVPLAPEPVDLEGMWKDLASRPPALGGYRALLFDLYGTLFISAAGDMAVTPEEGTAREAPAPEEGIAEARAFFRQRVEQYHAEERARGNPWPEVVVEEIWADYRGPVPGAWGSRESMDSRELALRYELTLNPVYPMPRCRELIQTLARRGMVLGIISNAQFFSPLLFTAFFGAPPEDLGFDAGLLLYSFEKRKAKPSPDLFAQARSILAQRGIGGEETLYVGNDMGKDMVPAAAAGFKTALFAGDRRSLRLRETDPACAACKPDLVLRDLQALMTDR